MKKTLLLNIPLVLVLLLTVHSCGDAVREEQRAPDRDNARSRAVEVPAFNRDSAYFFVDQQVAFGPRVPNTEAHRKAGEWLAQTLGGFADTLYIQRTRTRAYDGTVLNIKNIIGVFQPEKTSRILLCAHWDSRPYADHDPDPEKHYTPIDGANDGASGVGVLMEIARIISEKSPNVGVDIIFFDAEDYGQHQSITRPDQDSWALGSQHWARNPHRSDYNARFGILLDMVGASGATFKKEGFSMLYAANIVRKVWNIARRQGYEHYFLNREGGYITDDHYYINKIRGIPTINIIHQDETTSHGFFPEWHTTGDTMEVIDPETLKVVGQTVLAVLFSEN